MRLKKQERSREKNPARVTRTRTQTGIDSHTSRFSLFKLKEFLGENVCIFLLIIILGIFLLLPARMLHSLPAFQTLCRMRSHQWKTRERYLTKNL